MAFAADTEQQCLGVVLNLYDTWLLSVLSFSCATCISPLHAMCHIHSGQERFLTAGRDQAFGSAKHPGLAGEGAT